MGGGDFVRWKIVIGQFPKCPIVTDKQIQIHCTNTHNALTLLPEFKLSHLAVIQPSCYITYFKTSINDMVRIIQHTYIHHQLYFSVGAMHTSTCDVTQKEFGS